MEYEEIKNELTDQGGSFSLLARVMECSATAVRNVAKGDVISKRIAIGICKAIKKTPESVFPDTPQYHSGFAEQQAKQEAAHLKEWQQRLAS